jgi:hypothetical protein
MICLACFFRKPEIIALFISIALIVQIQWVIDLLFHLITGGYLTGNSSSVFEPGQTIFDFINSMRHLFMLPLALVAFYILPMPDKKKVGNLFLIWSLVVIPISYLVTNKSVNLNCTRDSCLGMFNQTNQYTPAILVFLLLLISYFIIFNLITKWKSKYSKSILIVAVVLSFVAVLTTCASYVEYNKINHYNCKYNINEFVKCEGIFFDYEKMQSYAVIRFDNKVNSSCLTEIQFEKSKIALDLQIDEERQKVRMYLPSPEQNKQLQISSRCT